MADDTEEARIARAKRLREDIKKELGKAEEKESERTKPRNPRDAIHDRMRELDKKR